MDAYEAELLALFVLSPYVKVEMRDMYRQYLQRSGSYNTIWAREGREAAIFAYPEHYMTDGDGDEANQVAQNHWETVMLPQLSSHWRLMFLMERGHWIPKLLEGIDSATHFGLMREFVVYLRDNWVPLD